MTGRKDVVKEWERREVEHKGEERRRWKERLDTGTGEEDEG